jgi:hypothetical protein
MSNFREEPWIVNQINATLFDFHSG